MFPRRNLRQTVLAILSVVFLLAVGLASPASAQAEIDNAVTDVRVTTSNATIFADVNFEVDWTVPNGSAGGDFFSLGLPPALDVPDSLTFDLNDAAGVAIAVATVNNGTITFTLTDAVNGQNNISGTAFITSGFNRDVIEEEGEAELTFVTGGGEFTQTIEITPFVPNPDAGKFLVILDEENADGNDILTGIDTRLITEADVGVPVVITDTPGPGAELDCSTVAGTLRDLETNDTISTLDPAAFTIDCSPTEAAVSFDITPDMVGTKVRFTFQMTITDADQGEFTNDAVIAIGPEETGVSAADAFLEFGGEAGADVFDLALIKQLADGTNLATVAPGDTVTFTITVENQGAIDAANIEVTDFSPEGLTLDDAAWTDNGDNTATLNTPIAALASGAVTTVDITFTVDADATGTLDNFAEISEATDADGNSVADIDSTPDAINDDVFTTDDATDGNGLDGGDEDDSDRAQINVEPIEEEPVEEEPVEEEPVEEEPDVFDLALIKQLADGTNLATVAPGDTVTFTITVFNQGDIDAANIEVTDFSPEGLTLDDAAWTDNGDNTATLNTPIAELAAGDNTTVDITFTVDADATGTIDNFAEISGATDTDGNDVTDIDSTPDAINDDLFTTDDATDGNGLDGGDEDDSDRAQITIEVPVPVEVLPQVEETPQLAVTGVTETGEMLFRVAFWMLLAGWLFMVVEEVAIRRRLASVK